MGSFPLKVAYGVNLLKWGHFRFFFPYLFTSKKVDSHAITSFQVTCQGSPWCVGRPINIPTTGVKKLFENKLKSTITNFFTSLPSSDINQGSTLTGAIGAFAPEVYGLRPHADL